MSKSRVRAYVALLGVAGLVWVAAIAAVAGSIIGAPARITAAHVANQVIVQFREDASATEQARVRAEVGATSHAPLSALSRDTELLKLDGSVALADAVATLERESIVVFAEPNYVIDAASSADDPSYLDGSQWGMQGSTSTPASEYGANAAGAWAKGYTGDKRVYVAVLDQGIEYTHPDLAANIWTNTAEIPDNGIDDDGNGFIDDVHGYNFIGGSADVLPATDTEMHGTHVAGIIGAVGGNATGVAGVNWQVSIIPVKVLNSLGKGTTASTVAGLDYVTMLRTQLGLHVVATNNSYGGGDYLYSHAMQDSIRRSGDAGILFVASAGNSGKNNDVPLNSWPSSYDCSTDIRAVDCVISVASIESNGTLSSFSNYGAKTVDIAAPGGRILSTIPNSGYKELSGTSQAAPHVTGALALCAAANRGLSEGDLKSILFADAKRTTALNGKLVSGGRLDIGAMLTDCASRAKAFAGAPSGLLATAYYTDRVRLEWNDNTSGEYGHEIQITEGQAGCTGTFTHLAYIGPGLNNFPVYNLKESSFYCFRIRAVRDSAVTGWSTSNMTITWTSNLPFITGKVLLADGVTPVAHVQVRWRANGAAAENDRVVYTDDDGTYAVMVSTGVQGSLWVVTPGTSIAANPPLGVVYPAPALPINLRAGGVLAVSADTTVNLVMPKLRTVTFHVTNESGSSLAGIRVDGADRNTTCQPSGDFVAFDHALPMSSEIATRSCTFDPEGHYGVRPPVTDSAGMVTLVFIDDSVHKAPYTVTFMNPADTSQMAAVSFSATEDTTMEVVLANRAMISGTLLTSDGSVGVSGAQIRWRAFGGTSVNDVVTNTVAGGQYALSVPRGIRGSLWVAGPHGLVSPATTPQPSIQFPIGLDVGGALTVSQDTTINITLPKFRTITFHVVDAAGVSVAGARIDGAERNTACQPYVDFPAFPGAQTLSTEIAVRNCGIDPFGHYGITPVTDRNGNVTLAFVDDGTFKQPYTITAVHPKDTSQLASASFRATADTTIELPLASQVKLTGRVFMADGSTTVANVPVRWRAIGGVAKNDRTATTASDGTYSLLIPKGAAGSLWVATPSTAESAVPSTGLVYPRPILPIALTVGGNLTVADDAAIDITLPKVRTVTFHVVEAFTNTPVAGAFVSGMERGATCTAPLLVPYYVAFPGATGMSNEIATRSCSFDPEGYYGSRPPQTDANGNVTLSFIDNSLFKHTYTVTFKYPIDKARIGTVTFYAAQDTTKTVIIPGTPAQPTRPSVTATSDEALLTWQEPWDGASSIDYYNVSQALNVDGPYTPVASGTCTGNIAPDQRSCTVQGLTPGTTYYFAIVAHNKVGASGLTSMTGVATASQVITWRPTNTSVAVSAGSLQPSAVPTVTPNAGAAITYEVIDGTAKCTVDPNSGRLSWTSSGTCVVAATAAGTSRYPQDVIATVTFNIVPAPVVSAISTTSGVVGSQVTITGTNFTGTSSVKFGTVEASRVFTNSAGTQITATLPLMVSSDGITAPISVTTPGGVALSESFSIVPPPVITSVSPARGAYGATATITGANLAQVKQLLVSGQYATFTIESSTRITFKVPMNASTGVISLIATNGSNYSDVVYTVIPAPIVNQLTPASGIVGSTVQIFGSYFTGATSVTFNGVPAEFQVSSPTLITAKVPAGAVTGTVRVTIPDAQSAPTTSSTFTVIQPPTITSLSVTTASSGMSVVIYGTNFTGATSVKFNGAPATAFTVSSVGRITATVPADATTGAISVTTVAGVGSSSSPLTVVKPPVITSLSATSGPAGTTLTVKGSNFISLGSVRLGSTAITQFTVVSPSELSFKVPVGASSGAVAITNMGGSCLSAATFTVLLPPTINSLSTYRGLPGSSVTITGTNLGTATTVTFNGVPSAFTVTNSTQISATVPTNATTGALTITTSAGSISYSQYIVQVQPVLSAGGPTSASKGQTILLKATLMPILSSQSVSFTINGVKYSGYTNSSGVASVAVKAPGTAGQYLIRASCAGNSTTFVAAQDLTWTLTVS